MTPTVVALVGTDHHRFDRMVDWIDAIATRRPDVRFVIQHGVSKAPLAAVGHDFLAHSLLVSLLRDASVVVCHGGPGTILDARGAGHVPVVMARDPRRGEHVDGHQQRFAEMMGQSGFVRTVWTDEELDLAVGEGLTRAPGRGLPMSVDTEREAARARLAHELDALLVSRPRRLARLQRNASLT